MLTTIYFSSTGNYDQAVVGEGSYQSNIRSAYEEENNRLIEISLILEPHNPYDKNAVCVSFDGETLGYLSREDAVIYRSSLGKLGHPQSMGICKAKITGGGEKHYGIVLDLDIRNLRIEKISQPPREQIEQTVNVSKPLSVKSNKTTPLIIGIVAICATVAIILCLVISIVLISFFR